MATAGDVKVKIHCEVVKARSLRSDALVALALAVPYGAGFAAIGLAWHTQATIATTVTAAAAYGIGWFSARRGLDPRG